MEKAEGFSFGFLEFIEFLRITHAAKPKFHHKFRFFNDKLNRAQQNFDRSSAAHTKQYLKQNQKLRSR